MMNIKEFYILGLPIDTDIGECHFLKVKEYPNYFVDLQVVALTKEQIIRKYSELNKDGSLDEFIEEIKKRPLYDVVVAIPELQIAYYNLFTKVFGNEKTASQINLDSFDFYRKLVLEMNCIKEEVINPNPEIQKAIERSRRVKNLDGEKLDFSDIITSVVGFNGITFNDINEFTIFQLYMIFHRIAQFKNYDTSALFATVSSETVKIDSWSKHIDLFEEEKHAVEKDKFMKMANGWFGNK